jgi:hypothetical protein
MVKYIAYLTQDGSNTPVARVVLNTYTSDLVWIVSDTGEVTVTRTGEFNNNTTLKVVLNWKGIAIAQTLDNDRLRATACDINGNEQDGLLLETRFEIHQD